VKHRIEDLLDIPRLQAALDSLYASSNIPSAIIDNDGNVHTGSGWQDLCTKFHRVHPEARKRCMESDAYITKHINEANPSITYECPHGLVDAATPIIVEGEHIGSVFTGQLFLEAPDLKYFRDQAKALGFDEEKYIDAVKTVPIITRQALKGNLAFLAHLTGMLTEIGLKRTREKGAEKRLGESEERYRSLFGKASDGILIMSPDGKILEVNESFARMHGFSTGELLRMNIKDLDTPEASKLIPERMRRVLAGETLAIEVEHHHKDGHDFPLEVSANLISIGGEPFIQCFYRDITERKRAEEKLKQTIRLTQVLLDAFPCVALLLRPRTREIVASNAAAVKVGAVPGAHCYSTWGQREDPCPWCRSPVVWDTGKEQHLVVEEAGTCWDAHWIPVSEDLYMHFAFDITERKRAEDALRASQKMIEEIINAIPVRVFWKDRNLVYLGCNSVFARDAGFTDPKEVIGKDDFQMGWREQAELYRADDRQVIESGCSKLLIEEPQTTSEGKTITLLTSKIPLRNSRGEIGGVIGTYYDITDRKRAEEEKVKLEGQLQQAMKMEAVGRLAGGVAHDFNNLLTVISGYSDLLLQKFGKESPVRGQVEEIKRAGERAASLTQQLLAFSRKQIIEPRVVRLDLLVADMQAMLTRLIGEHISIQVGTGKSLGSVKVDPVQFQQVLMNLAVNARDAMPGGGKIVIETSNVDLDETYCALHPYVTPGRFVMLAISDTGHGMSEEIKGHIFEPFFTTKERGSGTGLGLATAYGAVHQAGGSIEVYSEVGIGTTIKTYFPRVEGEAAIPVIDDRPADLPGGTETVLVVEDESIVLTLCVQILERLGYKVLQARNGTEAIAEAKGYGGRIDLLLTDVVMPGMNGADLAAQLVLHHAEMKVLFTSGYTDDAIVRHGVLDEGVSFIGKPYTPSTLARKVREVIDEG
jgi:PAS domain S-box-containing protein